MSLKQTYIVLLLIAERDLMVKQWGLHAYDSEDSKDFIITPRFLLLHILLAL